MTPEKVAYYRAMLMVGLGDGFYAAFDKAVEEEDPLSDLILSLCTCISNESEVLHILTEYTLDCTLDEETVRDLIVEDIKIRYEMGNMTRADVVRTLEAIVRALDRYWQEPWFWCTEMVADLETYQAGYVSEAAFNECFDHWWNYGQCLDIWAFQRKMEQQKYREQHQSCRIIRDLKKAYKWLLSNAHLLQNLMIAIAVGLLIFGFVPGTVTVAGMSNNGSVLTQQYSLFTMQFHNAAMTLPFFLLTLLMCIGAISFRISNTNKALDWTLGAAIVGAAAYMLSWFQPENGIQVQISVLVLILFLTEMILTIAYKIGRYIGIWT